MTTMVDPNTGNKKLQSLITKPALFQLVAEHHEPCVSLLMPTVVKGDTAQNSIRFKNLIKKTESELKKYSLKNKEVAELLEKPNTLLSDDVFWEYQNEGLAVYVSPDFFGVYKLPLAPVELAVVNNRFMIKPLLPIFSNDGRFFLLALSQKSTKLFEGTQTKMHDLKVSFPTIDEFHDKESQLQQHSPSDSKNRGSIQFHGQGAGKDNKKEKIQRLLSEIDKKVHEVLKGQDAALLLAGVDYVLPIYRSVNTYPRLTEKVLEGNPENIKSEELHRRVLKLVDPLFKEDQDKSLALYHKMKPANKTSSDIRKILVSANQGLIDTLFVARHQQVWGLFEPTKNKILIHDEQQTGDDDLLDLASVLTMKKGGAVYVVASKNMPGPTAIAALYRYKP